MAFSETEKIWFNGKLVDWHEARIHVLSHVVHYGSSWFEGMRCYNTVRGPAIFRLQAHLDRLFNSCKIYRVELPFSKEEIHTAILQTIRANNLESCYIRPVVYRGYGDLSVNPFGCPVEMAIAVWPWGQYLGEEALEQGVEVCISSWNRPAPNTYPALAKAGGNYLSSQLIRMEALIDGYAEGIALSVDGNISEGSGENIFLVKGNTIYTTPLSASILGGITRDSVLTLAQEADYTVREEAIPREALYIADEVFFAGTAAEITPIRTIDKVVIGPGKRGPVTRDLQERFFAIVNGQTEDRHGWLTFLS